jgi:hypothetical protein
MQIAWRLLFGKVAMPAQPWKNAWQTAEHNAMRLADFGKGTSLLVPVKSLKLSRRFSA